jgi:hypothetical protein
VADAIGHVAGRRPGHCRLRRIVFGILPYLRLRHVISYFMISKVDMNSNSMLLTSAVLIGLLSLQLAACSGSEPGHPAPVPTTKTSPKPARTTGSPLPAGSQTTSGPDAAASVKADWTEFFDPATPIAERLALLQDGAKFKSYLQVQARPGLAHLTTEQVTDVTVIGMSAMVTYNILVDGHTASALTGQSGQATFNAGTWQVSDTDFCSLLTLENKGKPVPGCA